MFQRDQWGLVSPLPWGLSEQGGTAATSEALLSLFMQMGLIPREPALKPLSTGLVKFSQLLQCVCEQCLGPRASCFPLWI